MTIGKNIADLRKSNGMTQEQLAETLGVSSQTVSKWENEITMPDIMLLPVIAGCFDITVDELYGGRKTIENAKLLIMMISPKCCTTPSLILRNAVGCIL